MARETCTVSGCTNFVKGRGLCNKHYLALARKGQLTAPNRTERVLAFIELCCTSATDQCIEPSFKSKSEYPTFIYKGTHYSVGWMVLEKTKGLRPDPTQVMRHVVCGNPRCCNPRHLEWGTEAQNTADKSRDNRRGEIMSDQSKSIQRREAQQRGENVERAMAGPPLRCFAQLVGHGTVGAWKLDAASGTATSDCSPHCVPLSKLEVITHPRNDPEAVAMIEAAKEEA